MRIASKEYIEQIKGENKNLKNICNELLEALTTILELPSTKIYWETIEEIVKKAKEQENK